ncbi:cyclin-dependent kinase inhibitor 3 family protein [Salinisphaera hydrothermalis]|uniref:Dual specificity protein phosphatase n=1 Tax=Salinisphaera hydrothermalis (strain C41B8) TaxID=1304275 RepID=A0A084IIR5_SALHC|nr:cyclin-dependent kinase inhibitor 3 family protein [Salinisphaera hydrothermalis]KEZ76599.1 dual specificity protein phosphatase [Salinisphaera hydrothermalis C41B8]
MHWRTSITDPLRIDAVDVPGTSAHIGMTLCPGKTYPWGRHGAWHRDLAVDLAVIEHWGAQTLISLIEDHEFETLQVAGLGEAAQARGLTWRHWPIRDRDIPDERFEADWAADIDTIASDLQAGCSLVLHCMGGLGRSGTVAARLLTYFGLPASEAVEHVRAARPGAIETGPQLEYVLSATAIRSVDLRMR